ncbi:hypothetical protein, partial [Clostridioides difficile]|uniref:hypothetical protein n=1 Tax=Clostridioides difficile TaxID=1496 RepID=UPI001F3DC565
FILPRLSVVLYTLLSFPPSLSSYFFFDDSADPEIYHFLVGGRVRCVIGTSKGVVFPKEGSGWDLEANALVKKDNIKKEAKLF